MMKWFLLILVLFLSACVSGEMTVDQSGICSFKYSSFYKDMQAPNLDLCGATLGADNSSSKDEVLKALLNAL